MKKIIYCMHVGWNWIKQRPHYIAEELSEHYNMTVLCEHSYRTCRGDNKKSEYNNIRIIDFYKIPMLDHFRISKKINDFFRKIYYYCWIKISNPDYVYAMKPDAVKFIPKLKKNTKLIYDCMDDMLCFTEDENIKKYIFQMEKKLVEKADLVIASSNHLGNVLLKRYNMKELPLIVRNAYNGEISKQERVDSGYTTDVFTICYFGTIASWFNFEFIIKALDEIERLEFLLIGPTQAGTVVPQHVRLNYVGSVEHDLLAEKTKDVNAFIMPFIVNDLIESVDPVKLYEYINFNKDILCVRYEEVERFDKFVYFYEDYTSFKKQIYNMMNTKKIKYSSKERIEFLESNTWKNRADLIIDAINKIDIRG